MRAATSADIAQLAQLEALCNPSPWSAKQLRQALCAPNHIWVHPDDNGHISAMLVWQTVVDEAEIHLIDTHPDCRRQGLAQDLLATLYATACRENLHRILLEVRAGNTAALALYHANGFIECGRRRGYYAEAEDAILMERPC